MANETAKIRAKLSSLLGSLEDLETELEPLLAQTLPETVLGLETIQQAKLQVVLPYLVYDLVFIYLKTKGIDPKTHPVIAELARVRQYFDKIKNAEDPPKPSVTVDKAAANRFIKHAINQVKNTAPIAGPSTHIKFNDDGTTRDVRIPVKVTAKMLEREEYQKKLREEDSEDEADLEIIDDEPNEEDAPRQTASGTSKGKGKASSHTSTGSVPPETTLAVASGKRRRPAIDPFTGYAEPIPAGSPQSAGSTSKRTKVADIEAQDDPTGGSAPPSDRDAADKKAKKLKKKKKKLPLTA